MSICSTGLVEVCKVVGATYHKRLLPSPASASQRERPGTANTAADSAQTTQNISTPPATPQQRTIPAPGALSSRPQLEVSSVASQLYRKPSPMEHK